MKLLAKVRAEALAATKKVLIEKPIEWTLVLFLSLSAALLSALFSRLLRIVEAYISTRVLLAASLTLLLLCVSELACIVVLRRRLRALRALRVDGAGNLLDVHNRVICPRCHLPKQIVALSSGDPLYWCSTCDGKHPYKR